jgi:hypothetical protein
VFEIVQKHAPSGSWHQRLNLAVFGCNMLLMSTGIMIQKTWPLILAGVLWVIIGAILIGKAPRKLWALQIVAGAGLVALILTLHRHPIF